MATTVSLKPNAVEISGSTSGTTTLQATAVAGTTTLTLPAATDTLVGKATTDTLTNKTLTSPTITGGALNGTVGATTPSTGAFTTISTSGLLSTNANLKVVNGANDFGTIQLGTSASYVFTGGATFSGYRFEIPSGQYDFQVGSASKVLMNAFGIGLGASTPSSGAGITFPATQSASSDANTLDDYEEGTWTPIFLPETNSFTSSTYDIQSGRYTKIGRVVYFDFALRTASLTIGTATNSLRISGLPFTVSSNTQGTAMIGQSESWGGDFPSGAFIRGSTQLVSMLYRTTANGVTSSIQVSDMATAASSNEISGGGFYII